MIVWVDAQLSPRTARWLSERFAVEAIPVRDLDLREASDQRIYEAARSAGAVVMTKDVDFVGLLERLVRRRGAVGDLWQHLGCTASGDSRRRVRHRSGNAGSG